MKPQNLIMTVCLSLARAQILRPVRRALLPVRLAVVVALLVSTVSSRAQTASVYALSELPTDAILHRVTATPTEYKGRKALRVELTEAANKGRTRRRLPRHANVRAYPCDAQKRYD